METSAIGMKDEGADAKGGAVTLFGTIIVDSKQLCGNHSKVYQ